MENHPGLDPSSLLIGKSTSVEHNCFVCFLFQLEPEIDLYDEWQSIYKINLQMIGGQKFAMKRLAKA